jgi:hypothetical protein
MKPGSGLAGRLPRAAADDGARAPGPQGAAPVHDKMTLSPGRPCRSASSMTTRFAAKMIQQARLPRTGAAGFLGEASPHV